MNGNVFVDTNVLVYCRDASESHRQPQALEWMRRLWESGRGRVSVQVLQEYFVTVTAKLKPGLPREEARQDVRALFAWRPWCPDAENLITAWDIQDRYHLSFWDSLIAAAAQATDCGFILTEDLHDGQIIGQARVVNPFIHEPHFPD